MEGGSRSKAMFFLAQKRSCMKRILVGLFVLTLLAPVGALTIGDREALATGKRIWKNECSGTVEGLTSWNYGEDFASLGIGHFIWYPEGRRGPFQESFPPLLVSLRAQGVKLPGWLEHATNCPWNSRQAFLADLHGAHMEELRQLLASTVAQQARFIADRTQASLPRLLAAVPDGEKAAVRSRFNRVLEAPGGVYALQGGGNQPE
jgi:hypothetical protein